MENLTRIFMDGKEKKKKVKRGWMPKSF